MVITSDNLRRIAKRAQSRSVRVELTADGFRLVALTVINKGWGDSMVSYDELSVSLYPGDILIAAIDALSDSLRERLATTARGM